MPTIKTIAKFSLIAVLAASLNGCITSLAANQQASKLYDQHITELQSKRQIDKTSKTAKRVTQVFNRIKPIAQADNQTGTDLHWELNVVKSDDINAWAMAGGKMVVYTGLVDKLKLNDHEIATVVGHEMAHVLLEHSKKQANVELWAGVVSSVGGAMLTEFIGDDIGMTLVDEVKNLTVSKPYSRSKESEADALGLMLMAKAGYDPEYAPKLWGKMSAANGGDNKFLALLSTHPSSKEREENLAKLVPEAKVLRAKYSKN